MSSELHTLDTGQRIGEPSEEVSETPIEHAVGQLAANNLLLFRNKSVYALVANANSPTMLEDIRDIKDDPGRDTVGWAVPFGRALPLVETRVFTDRRMKDMLGDPYGNELTARYAGLGFICMLARKSARKDPNVPRGLISPEYGTLQPYSATGNDFASKFIRSANTRGIDTVLTSGNRHGQPESVTRTSAEEFARRSAGEPLFILEDEADQSGEAPEVRGSYPIIFAHKDHFELIRPGCIGTELIADCFADYDFHVPASVETQVSYPEFTLHREDLPQPYQQLKGSLMRLAVLATLGWSAGAQIELNDRLGELRRPAILQPVR